MLVKRQKAFAITDPENTIVSAKRLIGRSKQDIENKYPSLPYQFVGDDNHPNIQTRQRCRNPVQVSSEILAQLSTLLELKKPLVVS